MGLFMNKNDKASAKRPKLEVFVDSDWAGVTDDGQDLRKHVWIPCVCERLVGAPLQQDSEADGHVFMRGRVH